MRAIKIPILSIPHLSKWSCKNKLIVIMGFTLTAAVNQGTVRTVMGHKGREDDFGSTVPWQDNTKHVMIIFEMLKGLLHVLIVCVYLFSNQKIKKSQKVWFSVGQIPMKLETHLASVQCQSSDILSSDYYISSTHNPAVNEVSAEHLITKEFPSVALCHDKIKRSTSA